MRDSLQALLGYEFNLANFAICKPCWKMMQLIQDFRLRCFMASEVVQRMSKGLDLTADDGWFSAKSLAMIENVRISVQDQIRHISKINVTRRTLVLDDSTDIIKEKQNDAAESVDEQPSEDLTSELTLGVTKVEPSSETNHKCNICFEDFPSINSLSAHLFTHPDAPKCRMYCDMHFNSVQEWAEHSRVCTEIPQNCRICGKQQRNGRKLQLHYEQEHPDASEGTFACGTCGKRFRRFDVMRDHERKTHSKNLFIYPCEVCGRMFSRKSSASLHLRKKHSKERVSEEGDQVEE